MGRPALGTPRLCWAPGAPGRTEDPPGPSKEAASVQASPLNLTPALGNSTVEPQLWSRMPGSLGPVGP